MKKVWFSCSVLSLSSSVFQLGRVFEVALTAPVEILLFIIFVSLELNMAAVPFGILVVTCMILHCMFGSRQGGLRSVEMGSVFLNHNECMVLFFCILLQTLAV